MKSPRDLQTMRAPSNAKHIVAFTIINTEQRYHALALAYMILTFMVDMTRLGDYKRFKMVDLCYEISPSRIVHGAMYFTHHLEAAYYRTAKLAGENDEDYYTTSDGGHVISTWTKPCQTFGAGGIKRHVDDFLSLTRQVTRTPLHWAPING